MAGLKSLGTHWGVSPEFLHLDSIEVPLGFYLLVRRIEALWAQTVLMTVLTRTHPGFPVKL